MKTSHWIAVALGTALCAAIATLTLMGFRPATATETAKGDSETGPDLSTAATPSPDLLTSDGRYTAAAAALLFEPIFSTLDCERTGSFQQPEIDEHFAQVLRFTDPDRSRTISLSEYVRGARGPRGAALTQLFERADEDSNSVLSTLEYRKQLLAMFDVLDQSKDGEVSRAELTGRP